MTDIAIAVLVLLAAGVIVLATAVTRAVWIIPQARARNVERLGRYSRTLQPGISFVVPFVDRVKNLIDLREQVIAFKAQPVITEDNVVVHIDTVLFFQVTDPRAADYEIVDYIKAIEQLTATTLRNVIGTLDLEATLTSRDRINTALRGVLDDASGKWGIRVTRVEIKAIEPPPSIKDAMEKQMRAEREKRAAILTAEGGRQARILTAEGEKQSAILRAEGAKRAAILEAEGQSIAIEQVFASIHAADPDPKLLAYQYLQTLPKLAEGQGSTFWVIPSEVTSALQAVSQAFGGTTETATPVPASGAGSGSPSARRDPGEIAGGTAGGGTAGAIGAGSAGGAGGAGGVGKSALFAAAAELAKAASETPAGPEKRTSPDDKPPALNEGPK
ncbi:MULTISPECIES: SPFH domain-containing protein [Actinomadura]|uniref:SPFH domain-containing protein n=1 Tax=Actinomadura yumaensis TaxID=111807 RepID=A0ABW2CQY9_9ACTN|nr:SPFH domain-containing protein [Actinomadura sp. J1-007]MWK35407.1 SPFH/Band 7/PHB domain protein [Actinomadura sp. J1-007]